MTHKVTVAGRIFRGNNGEARIHSDPNRPIALSSTRKELLRLYRLRYKRYHDHADLVIPVLPKNTPEKIAERIRIE